MTSTTHAWVTVLEADAPDTVACWRAIDGSFAGLKRLRRELRARIHAGGALRILAEQESVGAALERVISTLPEELLRAPVAGWTTRSSATSAVATGSCS